MLSSIGNWLISIIMPKNKHMYKSTFGMKIIIKGRGLLNEYTYRTNRGNETK